MTRSDQISLYLLHSVVYIFFGHWENANVTRSDQISWGYVPPGNICNLHALREGGGGGGGGWGNPSAPSPLPV